MSACVWILKVERLPGSSSVGEKILYELESTVNNVCQLWMGSALHVYHEYAQKLMKHNEIKHLTTPRFFVTYDTDGIFYDTSSKTDCPTVKERGNM